MDFKTKLEVQEKDNSKFHEEVLKFGHSFEEVNGWTIVQLKSPEVIERDLSELTQLMEYNKTIDNQVETTYRKLKQHGEIYNTLAKDVTIEEVRSSYDSKLITFEVKGDKIIEELCIEPNYFFHLTDKVKFIGKGNVSINVGWQPRGIIFENIGDVNFSGYEITNDIQFKNHGYVAIAKGIKLPFCYKFENTGLISLSGRMSILIN